MTICASLPRNPSVRLAAALLIPGLLLACEGQTRSDRTARAAAARDARPDLYRAGVFRKYLLVVTDGENAKGATPEDVAREIWEKSQGGVQTYFVAFDTSPEKFAFLKQAGGDVIGAGTGAELRTAL